MRSIGFSIQAIYQLQITWKEKAKRQPWPCIIDLAPHKNLRSRCRFKTAFIYQAALN